MVQHDKLWLTMLEFPPHLVQLLRNLYRQQRAALRVAGMLSNWFIFYGKKGVRQGCNLSPSLFNLLAEALMRRALDGYNRGFKIGGKTINNLRYADDIVIYSDIN